MSKKGRSLRMGSSFEVTPGEVWLFFAYQLFMTLHPIEGSRRDYWLSADDIATQRPGEELVPHNLGRHGLSHGRWRLLQRCFSLPMHPIQNHVDPFRPIRRFEEQWNARMVDCLDPGKFITVDESMALWKGRGMPGLMHVPRKPTPVGRETHTAADVETGVIIWSELYEGKDRMADKEFVAEYSKSSALALRCSKPWFNTGRTLILDSGFASLLCAKACANNGLYMIGNVKTGHRGFPRKWLLEHAPERGARSFASSQFTSKSGETWSVLAACDKDKQPMALIGTAGTTTMGETLFRMFTVVRGNGSFQTHSATLEQMDIHASYRRSFNAVDMANSKRQRGTSFEDTWKTHKWWVRDFQMLFGMSEVNAFLLMRHFKPGCDTMSFSKFRSRLVHQMLRHTTTLLERREGRLFHGQATSETSMRHAPCVNPTDPGKAKARQVRCRMCGEQTYYHCVCMPPPKKGSRSGHFGICSARVKPECLAKHMQGESAPNRKREGVQRGWETRKAQRTT